jgi:penicillin-binding protein 1C
MARAPAFGRHGPLERGTPVKTGTSQAFRDNWAVGYTEQHVVGVWVGNFDGRPMLDVSGVTGAAPLWADIVDLLGVQSRPPAPAGLVPVRLCALSGGLATEHCPRRVDDHHLGEPPAPCSWHLQDCSVAWPVTYASWASEQGRSQESTGCAAGGQARIAFPVHGTVLFLDPRDRAPQRQIWLKAGAAPGALLARWWVDGELLATVGPPFDAPWRPGRTGAHRIAVEVGGARDEVEVHISGGVHDDGGVGGPQGL